MGDLPRNTLASSEDTVVHGSGALPESLATAGAASAVGAAGCTASGLQADPIGSKAASGAAGALAATAATTPQSPVHDACQAQEIARCRAAGLAGDAIDWVARGLADPVARELFSETMHVNVCRRKAVEHCAEPRDPYDIARCIWLARRVPKVQSRLSLARAMSPLWALVIDHWQHFDRLVPQEDAPWDGGDHRTCAELIATLQQLSTAERRT